MKIGNSLFVLLDSYYCKKYNIKKNDVVLMKDMGNDLIINKEENDN